MTLDLAPSDILTDTLDGSGCSTSQGKETHCSSGQCTPMAHLTSMRSMGAVLSSLAKSGWQRSGYEIAASQATVYDKLIVATEVLQQYVPVNDWRCSCQKVL